MTDEESEDKGDRTRIVQDAGGRTKAKEKFFAIWREVLWTGKGYRKGISMDKQ